MPRPPVSRARVVMSYSALLLLVGAPAVRAQTSTAATLRGQAHDSVARVTVDMTGVDSAYPGAVADRRAADSLYISVLEKTNQQLGLATNPLSLMVAALGVLFTIGAIVAGWLLYRQGRDYRDQRDKTLKEAGVVVVNAVAEMQAQVDALTGKMRSQFDEWHAELTQQIEDATARGDQARGEVKKEIENELAHLRKQRADIEKKQKAMSAAATPRPPSDTGAILAGIPRPNVVMLSPSTSLMSSILNKRQKCSHCGREFTVPATLGAALVTSSVECPYCHTVQKAT